MKITFVTSFSNKMFQRGVQVIDTVRKYFPDSELYVYHEGSEDGFQPTAQKNVIFKDLYIECPWMQEFVEKSKFNTDEGRFEYFKRNGKFWFRKVVALYHASTQVDNTILFWLDADTVVNNELSQPFLEYIHEHDTCLFFRSFKRGGVKKRNPDNAWMTFNLHKRGKEVVEKFKDYYLSGKIFKQNHWSDTEAIYRVFEDYSKVYSFGSLNNRSNFMAGPYDITNYIGHKKMIFKDIRSNDIAVSVVIPTYNSSQHIERLIESIKLSTSKKINIVISDDRSEDYDELEEICKGHDDVRLISNTGQQGWTGNVNNGLMNSVIAEYYVVVNPDIRFFEHDRGCVDQLMIEMKKNKSKIGTFLPVDETLKVNNEPIKQAEEVNPIRNTDLLLEANKVNNKKRLRRKYNENIQYYKNLCGRVDLIAGCFMVINFEAFDKLQLFNEKYKHYDSDYEWCYRARRKKQHAFLSDRLMLHFGKKNSKDMDFERKEQIFLENLRKLKGQ